LTEAYKTTIALYAQEQDPTTKAELLATARSILDRGFEYAFVKDICGDSVALKGIFMAVSQLNNPNLADAQKAAILATLGKCLGDVVSTSIKKERVSSITKVSLAGGAVAATCRNGCCIV
jgi:hypothetical protein